jgi:prevent-host-death family protein
MQTQVPAGEFKAHCLQLMNQVAATGQALVITKRGKPIAKLVPVESSEPEFGCMKAKTHIISDITAPIGEAWDADR